MNNIENNNLSEVLLQKIKSTNTRVTGNVSKLIRENFKKPFDDNGEITEEAREPLREILKAELNKWVKIYALEYGFELPFNLDELQVNIKDDKQLDCRGGEKGLTIYSKGQAEFDSMKNHFTPFMNITKGDNQRIYATMKGQEDCISNQQADKGTNTLVDSERDQLDYFAQLFQPGNDYIDMMLDVLPHEAMHTYIPGKGIIVEGSTELLARNAVDKFGGRLTPTSHSKETSIMRRVSNEFGKDVITSIGLTNDQRRRLIIGKELKELQELRMKQSNYKDELVNGEELDNKIQQKIERILSLSKVSDLDLSSEENHQERVLDENDIERLASSKKVNVDSIYSERLDEYRKIFGDKNFDIIESSFEKAYQDFLKNKINFGRYRTGYDERIISEIHQERDEQLGSGENITHPDNENLLDVMMEDRHRSQSSKTSSIDKPEKLCTIQEVLDEEEKQLEEIVSKYALKAPKAKTEEVLLPKEKETEDDYGER